MKKTRLDISSPNSFQLLHSLRASHDGVIVGINTMIFDQPRLNVRCPLPSVPFPYKQPRPIIFDSDLKLVSLNSIFVEKPIVFTCYQCDDEKQFPKKLNSKWTKACNIVESLGGSIFRCEPDINGRCCNRNFKKATDINCIIF